MIEFGRSIRWYNNYENEVAFSKENGFDFLQLWYKQGIILLDEVSEPREEHIKRNGFPVIIHALFDINEYEEYLPRLIEILKYLEHNEVIIHPVCESEEIESKTIYKLCEKIAFASNELAKNGVKLVLENNSRLDPIHYESNEIELMFSKNPDVEFLLDVAHIDNYQHLKELVRIKAPKILHVADKHFDIIHEHLPIGKGELDYAMIFNDVLKDFDGKIIFEILDDDYEIIHSKKIIEEIVRSSR